MVKSIILLLKFIKKTFTKIYNVSVKCSSNPVNPAPPGKRGVTSYKGEVWARYGRGTSLKWKLTDHNIE